MKVYSYDRHTSEYVGERQARPDPLTHGQFLVPARSTPIKPDLEAGDNQVVVFESGGWVVKEDHRGKVAYDSEGAELKIKIIGPLPDGYSLTKPEPATPEKTYIDKRMEAYGSVEEQIEYIIENGLEAAQARVANIKAQFPKE